MDGFLVKYGVPLLRALRSRRDASLFAEPVDVDAWGIRETYFVVVKHPMDLLTMERKIVERKYDTVDDFINDFHLIFRNFRAFNHKPVDGQCTICQHLCRECDSFEAHVSKRLSTIRDKYDAWISRCAPPDAVTGRKINELEQQIADMKAMIEEQQRLKREEELPPPPKRKKIPKTMSDAAKRALVEEINSLPEDQLERFQTSFMTQLQHVMDEDGEVHVDDAPVETLYEMRAFIDCL